MKMTDTEKQLLIVNKLIQALEAQRAILQGKVVYLKQVGDYVIRKHKVKRIQVSNISIYSPMASRDTEGIIDIAFTEAFATRLLPTQDIYEFIVEGEEG